MVLGEKKKKKKAVSDSLFAALEEGDAAPAPAAAAKVRGGERSERKEIDDASNANVLGAWGMDDAV